MNGELRDDCPSPEILRFENAYRGRPCKMFTLKNRLEFITGLCAARTWEKKSIPHVIPSWRLGFDLGGIESSNCEKWVIDVY